MCVGEMCMQYAWHRACVHVERTCLPCSMHTHARTHSHTYTHTRYLVPGGSAAHFKREGYTFDVGSSMMFGFGDKVRMCVRVCICVPLHQCYVSAGT